MADEKPNTRIKNQIPAFLSQSFLPRGGRVSYKGSFAANATGKRRLLVEKPEVVLLVLLRFVAFIYSR